jgi:hypothetical protein
MRVVHLKVEMTFTTGVLFSSSLPPTWKLVDAISIANDSFVINPKD